ncbi:MAG: hypothetical protein K8R90_05215 [Candidatus Cloacimonetes bacterium]|nr:hypothetical protein [Candidatus Cloacimonadota bacterium]
MPKKRKGLMLDGDGRVQAEMTLMRASLAGDERSPETDGKQARGYIEIPFRALSAAHIDGYCIDFSRPGVLEAAVEMFNDIPVYPDHYHSVDRWVGKTAAPHWSEASGDVPAGIDLDVRVYDGADLTGEMFDRQNKLIVGLREGVIRACSASVLFEWERSHPDLTGDAFWDMLGHEVDDEIVRFVVTKIVKVGELSLVWEGADPYARRLAAANETQAEMAKVTARLEESEKNLAAKTADCAKLETEAKGLHSQAAELAAYRKTLLEELKRDTVLLGESQHESYLKFLETQSLTTLLGIVEAGRAKLDAACPLQCADCGSHNVARRSSVLSVQAHTPAINEEQYKTGGKT